MLELICITLLMVSTAKGNDLDFQSLYRRIPQTFLRAIPQKVIENGTIGICARSCVTETEFECKSFDFDNINIECHLHNHTHTEPLIGLQQALGVDHYRTAYEKLFNRIPNHVITMRHKRNIRGLTVEECARRCILEMSFKCRGFDHERLRNNCWLTDKFLQDVDGLKRRTNTDYYERKTNGLLSRFINYGYGSLQTIEGVQTHTKIVIGVTIDACAQLCLAETTFSCVSFDYVFGEQSCQLSQYIAANVHGLRTEFEAGYQVMHFELIDEFLDYFYPTPYASVLGNNERTYRKVTPETCARKCLEEKDFICRSFDYQIQKGTCLLSHVTGSDAGGLFTPDGVHVHHFEMKPSLDCGGYLTGERGTLASPNWPRHYSHHLNCTWSISVPEFKIILLNIHHLDLGYQTDAPCSKQNDILSFTEDTANGRMSTCIKNFQTGFSTLTNKVNVTFATNVENDAQGFRIFYQANWPCRTVLTTANGEFASPNWPSTYSPMSSCHWLIQAPSLAKVILRINSVELEDHLGSSCHTAYDKLVVYDGNSSLARHMKTLCGHERASTFKSKGNAMYITFISDSRVQAKGFHASYTFLPYTTTTSTTTTTTTTTITSTTSLTTVAKYLDHNINNASTDIQREATNMSAAIHLAMTGQEEDEADKPLEAIFTEIVESDDTYTVTENKSSATNGKESDDIGRGGNHPEISTDITRDDRDYSDVILGVTMAFLTMLLVMIIAFALVCRHYRRRVPKLRQGTNMHTAEENMSLCHKPGNTQEGEFQDEGDVDEAARLPLPGTHDAIPDVEFHNPLYSDRQCSDSPSRMTVDSPVRDLPLSQTSVQVHSDSDRSDTETTNTVDTNLALTPCEIIYVDCLTTV